MSREACGASHQQYYLMDTNLRPSEIAAQMTLSLLCFISIIVTVASKLVLHLVIKLNYTVSARSITEHLDKKGKNYVRAVFIDFSSAFNTINTAGLINKMNAKNISNNKIAWTNDFLMLRTQES